MTDLKVSVIVPCYNEENTIHLLLESLYKQTFPMEQMEVVIADGKSEDNTRDAIKEFSKKHPKLLLKVVDNDARTIPAALNIAIKNAKGEYIVRLDAHSVPNLNYIELCVAELESGKGKNVGGIWKIEPSNDSQVARAIAVAAAHPLGVGDAKYRYTNRPQEVDTVPFGAFRRDLIKHIGEFDETLLSNEDYEFNVRIRKSGGNIWLNPEIQAIYFARPTYRSLIKQYWRYGYWKANMLKRYPETIRYRQALPPLFVVSIIGLAIMANWGNIFAWILGIEVVLYALVLILVGLQQMQIRKNIWFILTVPLAIVLMHFSWGIAFLWGSSIPAKK